MVLPMCRWIQTKLSLNDDSILISVICFGFSFSCDSMHEVGQLVSKGIIFSLCWNKSKFIEFKIS